MPSLEIVSTDPQPDEKLYRSHHPIVVDHLVIVTSVVTVQDPTSYRHKSCFTPEERFQQTLKTISSIREKIPNAYIILSEGSFLSDSHLAAFKKVVDIIIAPQSAAYVQSIGECENKSIGEILQIQTALDFVHNRKIIFKRLFKVSGRYWLNETFQLERYSKNLYSFRHVKEAANREILYYSTVVYSVPYSLLDHYKTILAVNLTLLQTNQGLGIKHGIEYTFIGTIARELVDLLVVSGTSGQSSADGILRHA